MTNFAEEFKSRTKKLAVDVIIYCKSLPKSEESFIIKKLINSPFLVESMNCNFNSTNDDNTFIHGEEDLEHYFDKNYEKKMEEPELNEIKELNEIIECKKEGIDVNSDDLNGFEEEEEDNDNINNKKDILNSETKNSVKKVSITSTLEQKDSENKNDNSIKLKKVSTTNTSENDNSLKLKKIATTNIIEQKDIFKSSNKIEKLDNSLKLKKVSTTNTAEQLRQIANDYGLSTTYLKDNKTKIKTKPMLIDELNLFLSIK